MSTSKMNVKIFQLEQGETADYTSLELAKYIHHMCGIETEIVSEKDEKGITLGLMSTLGIPMNDIDNPELDDAYDIHIENLSGYIAGSNIRSILYGVYAYLKEAGCRFLRPGKDGEYIPNTDLTHFTAKLRKKASMRYRFDCIEGSVSYEMVRDSVSWLPKVGYNGYLIQGVSPYGWYDRWYSHWSNPYKEAKALTVEEADEITRKLEHDIKRCGLALHVMGHDYMFPAYGLRGEVSNDDFDGELREHLAMINGERKIFAGRSIFTNFCYSNKAVRKKIVDFFVQYLQEKPYIDYLHVWMADSRDNSCECEACLKTTVSDLYVTLLNEIDEAFTEHGIKARISFELYNATCWPPRKERLKNTDRFVLGVAVRQNFIDGYSVEDPDIEIPEYIHNHYNVPPKHFPMTMGFLREWKKIFKGDCFFFDYHLYADHFLDPGYTSIENRLTEDTKKLSHYGSQGLNNIKSPRTQMPNSSPAYMCGQVLFDMNTDVAAERTDYFTSAYGEDGEKVRTYLTQLSELFLPDLMRDASVQAADVEFNGTGERISLPWMNNPIALKSFSQLQGVLDAFAPVIRQNLTCQDSCRRKSWDILYQQQQILYPLSAALCKGAAGNIAEAQTDALALIDQLARTEDSYVNEFEFFLYWRMLREKFCLTNAMLPFR